MAAVARRTWRPRTPPLAGLELESPVGPDAHSDGDAVLHALTDALLGAAGLAALGSLFPDTDPAWKDADSAAFLTEVRQRRR